MFADYKMANQEASLVHVRMVPMVTREMNPAFPRVRVLEAEGNHAAFGRAKVRAN